MRLFIAIQLNQTMKQALVSMQNAFRAQGVRGNYTREENMHLTLAFIGDYPDPDHVLEVMEEIEFEPIPLEISGIGSFGALWWAGLRENEDLTALVKKLRRNLSKAGIPFDQKKFRPHITLIRKPVIRGRHGSVPAELADLEWPDPGQAKAGQQEREWPDPGLSQARQQETEWLDPGQAKAGQQEREWPDPGLSKARQQETEWLDPGQAKAGQQESEWPDPGLSKARQQKMEWPNQDLVKTRLTEPGGQDAASTGMLAGRISLMLSTRGRHGMIYTELGAVEADQFHYN